VLVDDVVVVVAVVFGEIGDDSDDNGDNGTFSPSPPPIAGDEKHDGSLFSPDPGGGFVDLLGTTVKEGNTAEATTTVPYLLATFSPTGQLSPASACCLSIVVVVVIVVLSVFFAFSMSRW